MIPARRFLRLSPAEEENTMKPTLTSIPASLLLAALATAQPRYLLTDLGPAGNPFSQATGINNNGLLTGFFTTATGASHAALFYNNHVTDIGNPGLGGPNSGGYGINILGQIGGQAETTGKDPNHENFCGYGTGLQCVAFVWQFGAMSALPSLGGANSGFGAINNLGQIAGFAETARPDSECPKNIAVNGTGPQVLDFEATIWGPFPGQIRQLPPLPGDTVAMALGLNDAGQAVGTSGRCSDTTVPAFAAGPHAVFWDVDGSVHNLGSLGGTVNNAMLGSGTVAFAINDQEQVAGQASLSGDAAFHPFLWTKATGMQDLGVLPGDLVGAGLAVNNLGDIVGASVSAPGPSSGNPRAFLYHHGVMTDLNTLMPPNSPLYLLTACAINDRGEIAGFGVSAAGELHAFLAVPAQTQAFALPKNTTVAQTSIQLDGTQSVSASGGPLSYFWTIPPGSPSAAISAGDTATPTVTFTLRGTYTFQLTITDAAGTTSTDTAILNFQGN
jgi:probable HAF family extracellular repeat protein